MAEEALLQLKHLEVSFETERGSFAYLDDINFSLREGETLGIVGESGSGKSITCLAIMRLLDKNGRITKGEVCFEGRDLVKLSNRELDEIRGKSLTMIFQDAMSSLNPVLTIGRQLTESMRIHLGLKPQAARSRALAILRQIGLPNPREIMRSYPHMLSGGMQQRVMIAIALACNPRLLIADEPTTALDVTIQAQIMALLRDLREEIGLALILITHDIALVAETVDRVLVMYAGQIVEEIGVYDLFTRPRHPYTQLLLASVPSITDDADVKLTAIHGSVPEHYELIRGCRFYNRCPFARESCHINEQKLLPSGSDAKVRCQRAMAGEIPRTGREKVKSLVR